MSSCTELNPNLYLTGKKLIVTSAPIANGYEFADGDLFVGDIITILNVYNYYIHLVKIKRTNKILQINSKWIIDRISKSIFKEIL